MKARTIWLVAMAGLIGCADDRTNNHVADGGGFETGTIQARVISPSGAPASRAMVWLVASRGDTAPALVLDSAVTNAEGIALLDLPSDANRTSIGLDARQCDSFGILLGGLVGQDSAALRLAKSGSAEAWIDSTRQIPVLFVPGSHFLSERADGAPKSVLRLPQGAWDIALKTPGKIEMHRRIDIGASIEQLGEPAWSTKNLDWSDSLRHGLLCCLDSVLYRDPSLVALSAWPTLEGTIDGISFIDPASSVGPDSSILPVGYGPTGSGLQAPTLPLYGALSLDFGFDPALPIDSDLVRAIAIRNADGDGGLRLVVDPRAENPPSIEYLGSSGPSAFTTTPLKTDPVKVRKWIVAWDHKYYYILANGDLVASAYRKYADSSPPLIQFQAYSAVKGIRTGSIQLSHTRLYQPK